MDTLIVLTPPRPVFTIPEQIIVMAILPAGLSLAFWVMIRGWSYIVRGGKVPANVKSAYNFIAIGSFAILFVLLGALFIWGDMAGNAPSH